MEAKNRRAWIKNVAIIFLTVLLLLTFFSNTILNYSLPEVSAQYARYDSISGAIKANGTVKANESYVVTYDEAEEGSEVTTPGQTRKVVSVYVKQGSEVAIGDPILALEGGSSEELKTAEENLKNAEKELRELEKEYALAQLQSDSNSISSSSSMLKAQQELDDLKEKQTEAQEMYDLMLAGQDPAGALKTKMDAAEAEMKSIQKNKEAAEKVYNELKANIDTASGKVEVDYLSGKTLQERYAEAKALYEELNSQYTTLQNQLEVLEAAQKEHTENNESVTEAYEISKLIKAETESLDEKKLALSRIIEDHNIEIAIAYAEQYEKLAYDTDTETSTLPEKEALSSEITELERSLRRLLGVPDSMTIQEILSYVRDIEDRQAEIQKIQASIHENYQKLNILGMPYIDDITSYIYNNEQSKADKEVQDVKDQIEKIKGKYEEAEKAYTSLSEQISNQNYADENQELLATYEKDVENLTEKYEAAEKSYTAAKTEYEELKAPKSVEEALKALGDAKNEVALKELEIQKAQADNTSTEVTTKYSLEDKTIEIADKKADIEELKTKIKAMQDSPTETIVTAPIAGKIVEVHFVPGNPVASGNEVARIEVADKGYICEISMSTEEARKIQVGAECSVTNSWWYSDLTATVSQIRSDPQKPGKNRIVVIEVKGDVYEGQSLSFSIGDKSQSYDSVLPNSAIREDSEGKFVLVVESKNTPLSVRYTARRMNIEVITSDDTKSAVSGLYGSEFVITSATSPISDGQQVRLAEN